MTKSTITREQLLEIIETDHVQCGEASYLARMALAAMDGEPVAWTWHYREQWHVTSDKGRAAFVATDGDVAVLPLYRHAQSAPVVPKEMTAGIAVKHWEGGRGSIESFVAGYNFCRAAMLQVGNYRENANSSTNSPVIGIDPASGPDCSVEVRYVAPPGYVMVPKEPTAEMIWAAKYCFTSTPGWDVFKSAYIAMLAAAPQEVNHG
ncbi:hypothetical protein ACKDBF_000780 [Klebsiella pneumoniae]